MLPPRSKAAVKTVGTISYTEKGSTGSPGLNISGWTFDQTGQINWMTPDTYNLPDGLISLDGYIYGWYVTELHDMAHGSPCKCDVYQHLVSMGAIR